MRKLNGEILIPQSFGNLNISQQLIDQLDKKKPKDIEDMNNTIKPLTMLIFIQNNILIFGYLHYNKNCRLLNLFLFWKHYFVSVELCMYKIYCGPLFVWCFMKRQRILQLLIIFSSSLYCALHNFLKYFSSY